MDSRAESALAMRRAYGQEIARALDNGRRPDPFAVRMWESYVAETGISIKSLSSEAA